GTSMSSSGSTATPSAAGGPLARASSCQCDGGSAARRTRSSRAATRGTSGPAREHAAAASTACRSAGARSPSARRAWRRRTVRGMSDRPGEFVALGHGADAYAGLESFENPGVARVEMTSDELVAVCPITNQPDMYVATIEYEPDRLCLESKSLKLYLASFRNEGAFCEALAVRIRDDVAAALGLGTERVTVTLEQKARGGITIVAQT